MNITLYAAPGACSRVTMTALEEAGPAYAIALVRFLKQEHMSREYRARNPLGKVPSLVVDGLDLRENVAILSWLNDAFPEAQLLPPAPNGFTKAQQLADLCFCSSTLHPIVTRIALPMMFGSGDAIPDIRARAEAMMQRFLAVIEARLANRDYWYGDRWSVMDAYIGWVFARVAGVGFDTRAFSRLEAMMARQAERPSAVRVAAKEAAMQAQLESEGAALTPENLKAALETSAALGAA